MRIRLGTKLIISYLVLALVLAGVSGTYLSVGLRGFLFEQKQERLWRDAAVLRTLISERHQGDIASFEIDTLADEFGELLEVRVSIIDTAGIVWGDSRLDGAELRALENHRNRPELLAARDTGRGTATRHSTSIDLPLLYVALPLRGAPSPGFVRLAMPMSQIQEINRSAIKLVLLALALGLVLAVGLAFGGGLRISRPLRQMIDAAARMARGDFSQRLATSSSDEVGDLARSLNHMGERLQDLLAEATSGRQRLQAVLEGMMEGVLVVDVQRRLLVVNPSYRVMFDLDGDVIGQQLTEVTRSALLRDAFDRCMEQRQHVNEEVHLYGPPDRVLDAHVVPLIANGSVHGAVAVLHDITRLKQLEQVRRDFVANVSHELRTPLSAIKGYAETLLGGAGITEETRAEFLEVIERHADRMSRLVSDLLELARIEANPEAMTLEILDLRPVVDRVLNGLGSVLGERELELQVDFADHLPPVWADEGSIEQILNNLLDNAIKYTEPGGHIHLAAERRNRHLRVTVADTGIGIAAQHLKRIFERFYRVDKARSRELGGTGLGLSIVKHLVQLHGGRVWAESEPGKGTQITFELRIAG